MNSMTHANSVYLTVWLVYLTANTRCGAVDVFVDPVNGHDTHEGTVTSPVKTVHQAAFVTRQLLANGFAVTVQLLPGLHHIGNSPLSLGPADSGQSGQPVVWKSASAADPATIGAPIRITGWKQHPNVTGALIAPIPSNITRGTSIRQLWVADQRAERPVIFGHGIQPGDNKQGNCLNLTNTTATSMYPYGSQFDFHYENATDPSKWLNPGDVEFVYTSCDAINCWIEPRCTVQDVKGSIVSLKQDGNESCFHRLYYYQQCFNNGNGPGRQSKRGMNPTMLENVASNWTYPGQFYYDRAQATMGYIPRKDETIAMIEASATTSIAEQLLVINGTKNLQWEGVNFEYATWLGASSNRGYVDTQSAYLCQDGEPPVNVAVVNSTNITFSGCTFQHLGAVYALGTSAGSQSIIVSNNSFTDCSGGGVKLGSVGERGAPAPPKSLSPDLQDRGFLVSDNNFKSIPCEYSGANPIFAGYVADTELVHNTIHDSRYSGICAGWGWGEPSYVRNIQILNNSIFKPMQRLADGGGVYTNTPCPDCHVSGNYFESDPVKYGCLYHDGGSGLWHDENNVFNHINTHIVFTHGSSEHTTVNNIWYNDSQAPNLQGDTNNDPRAANGQCENISIININLSQTWPQKAQAIVSNAGKRNNFPIPVAPRLSPPAQPWPPPGHKDCKPKKPPGPPGPPNGAFVASTCNSSRITQQWILSPKVVPGDGSVTNIQLATGAPACWEVLGCSSSEGATVNCHYGCKPLPQICKNHCDCNGAWKTFGNGSIVSFMDDACLQISKGLNSPVTVGACTKSENQKFRFNSIPHSDGFTVSQGNLCIEQLPQGSI